MKQLQSIAAIYAMLDAVSSKVSRPQPCRCEAYSFPHRRGAKCDDVVAAAEEDRWKDEQHERDLQTWAARSRG